MRASFCINRHYKREGYKFIKRLEHFSAINARVMTEYCQLRYKMAMFCGQVPDDYIGESGLVFSEDLEGEDKYVGGFDLDDEYFIDEYMNRNEFIISKLPLNETENYDGSLVNIDYDYEEYERENRFINPKVPVKKLQLNFRGIYFKEVYDFEKLDKQVKNLYELNDPYALDLVFILTFRNGKVFEIPYRLSKADIRYFNSYGLIKAYCDAMKNCVEIFGEEVKSHMNKVQLDALEMSDYDF